MESSQNYAPMQLDAISIFDDVNFTNVPTENMASMLNNSLLRGYFDQNARYKMIANAFVAEKYYKLSQVKVVTFLNKLFLIEYFLRSRRASLFKALLTWLQQ